MKFIALGLTGFDPDRPWRRRRDQRCGRHRVMRQTPARSVWWPLRIRMPPSLTRSGTHRMR